MKFHKSPTVFVVIASVLLTASCKISLDSVTDGGDGTAFSYPGTCVGEGAPATYEIPDVPFVGGMAIDAERPSWATSWDVHDPDISSEDHGEYDWIITATTYLQADRKLTDLELFNTVRGCSGYQDWRISTDSSTEDGEVQVTGLIGGRLLMHRIYSRDVLDENGDYVIDDQGVRTEQSVDYYVSRLDDFTAVAMMTQRPSGLISLQKSVSFPYDNHGVLSRRVGQAVVVYR
ncbi:hypothetical protein [Rhodococcus sp. NBC_00297]|uniref:hypothetical protein n=1 Tax=Rhodococcus sp. NBC_00297 TaxID=2976005 RepID=UPI002E284E74|nr:hypothetical protein [Rhodococcus sp. NBC_00297]